MAKRRMVSKDIVQTQRFLRLPLEAQALYFHLMLSADDDGIVEAFPVVRMIGASEDSLGLLVVKRFIKALNDEMVYFIIDFLEQNKIRKDRYIPSVHKDLLDNGNQVADSGLPNGNQMADIVCHSIGKDSIGKDSIGKSNIIKGDDDEMLTPPPYQNCIGYWQQQVNANVNTITIDTLKEWVVKFGEQGDDIVKYGIDVMLYNGASRLGYLEAILKEWYGVHVDTVDKAKAYSEQRKQQQQQRNDNQQPVYHVEDYRKELYGE